MLTYDLSRQNGESLYYDLYANIRQDILAGRLRAHERLPSKRALATHLNLAVNTVTRAYEQLLAEGFVYARERRGYFVEELSDFHRQADMRPEPLPEPEEHEYLMDFKANRTGVQFFPASIWSRYMREALSLSNDSMMRVIPYNGLFELRAAIADYLERCRGIRVSPAQIIVGAGTEYLYGRLMQLFGRATTFAIEDPGYKKFADISAAYGNPWKYIPIDRDGLMIDLLEESGADVVHLSPANHFPTGTVMPISRRLQLFEWVGRARKRYIIEDDYDSEFRYTGRYIPPLFAADAMNKVVYINTFSKTLVPSLRISYMVLPPKLLRRYTETMSFYSCTVSSYEQYALARFIAEGHFERHINRMKNYYRRQRVAILSELQASPLGRISEIEERNAGTHFLLRVRTALTEEEVRRAAAEKNIHLSFFSDYSYAETPPGPPVLVINYAGIEPDRVGEVVAALASLFPECR